MEDHSRPKHPAPEGGGGPPLKKQKLAEPAEGSDEADGDGDVRMDSQSSGLAVPDRDFLSDRFLFPPVFVRHLSRLPAAVRPLAQYYDLKKLEDLLASAQDPANNARPRSVEQLMMHLIPAQLSPASIGPLRRLGQGYRSSAYASCVAAAELQLPALNPLHSVCLIGHAPPDDTAFLPTEQHHGPITTPTVAFTLPLAYALTSVYHEAVHMTDYECYSPSKKVMKAIQADEQSDIWTVQSSEEEQRLYHEFIKALVSLIPGRVSLVVLGAFSMGMLNLDRFGLDERQQIALTSANVDRSCAIRHPASLVRMSDARRRSRAVMAALVSIQQVMPERAYNFAPRPGSRAITLEGLYRAFVTAQKRFKVIEKHQVLEYDELPTSVKELSQETDILETELYGSDAGVQTWQHTLCGARIMLAPVFRAQRNATFLEAFDGMHFKAGEMVAIAPKQCPYCQAEVNPRDLTSATGRGRVVDAQTGLEWSVRAALPAT